MMKKPHHHRWRRTLAQNILHLVAQPTLRGPFGRFAAYGARAAPSKESLASEGAERREAPVRIAAP